MNLRYFLTLISVNLLETYLNQAKEIEFWATFQKYIVYHDLKLYHNFLLLYKPKNKVVIH